jgi:hypothetical protein
MWSLAIQKIFRSVTAPSSALAHASAMNQAAENFLFLRRKTLFTTHRRVLAKLG